MGEVRELIERLEKATGPDRELDFAIHAVFFPTPPRKKSAGPQPPPGFGSDPLSRSLDPRPRYTASLDAAVALVERVLPGWTWRVASCHASDDAWVIPDFNHPVHGERLMREYGQVEGDPASYWQEITDADLRPSGRPAIALCIALLRAKEETR